MRNISHLIEQQTGRPKRRLDLCAARSSTLASNPIAFSLTAHYRSQAGKLKAYGRELGSRHGLSGRLTESGMLARLVSMVGEKPATTYVHLIHREPTGSTAAVVISEETAWASHQPSGTRQNGSVPSFSFDRRITAESTRVGLTPSVFIESCPSLGQNKKGGVVPPVTQWPLF